MSVCYVLLNIDKEGTPSTKLGPKMGIESRSLTRTLKSMEEKNLIRRSANPDDKRVVLIHLTEDGKKYRDTSREVVIRLNQYLREHLEAEEVEVFFNVAKKINGLLDSPDIYELESELNSSEK